MATVNLLPTGDVSNDWTLSTGSDVYALLDDNHTGFITSDSSLLSSTSAGSSCIVSFADFGESYSAINSVTAVTRAGNNGRGRTFELTTRIISGGSGYTSLPTAVVTTGIGGSGANTTANVASRYVAKGNIFVSSSQDIYIYS